MCLYSYGSYITPEEQVNIVFDFDIKSAASGEF